MPEAKREEPLTAAEKEQLRKFREEAIRRFLTGGLRRDEAEMCFDVGRNACIVGAESLDLACKVLPQHLIGPAKIFALKLLGDNIQIVMGDMLQEALAKHGPDAVERMMRGEIG